MSKRVKKSSLKIKSSDGDEFEVDDDIVTKMETLKAMTMLVEDDEKEQVPTCQIDGGSMRKVILWTDYQNNFKNMNLKDTFQLIMSSDYLGNESLSEEMLRKAFLNNSDKDIDEAAKQLGGATIIRLLDDFKRRNEVVVTYHSDKLKYYDPVKSKWITMTKIPVNVRSDKKVCVIEDRVYILGLDDSTKLTDVAEYNAKTNIWRTISGSFQPVIDDEDGNTFSVSFFCSVGNKLYMQSSSYTWRYDETVGETSVKGFDLDKKDLHWNDIKTYYEPICEDDHPIVCGADDCFYLFDYGVVEKYDVEQDQWTTLTHKKPMSGYGTGLVELDGKLYVSGGGDESNSLDCYDISSDTWTTLATMNHGRSDHSLIVKNGSLIVVGGDVASIEEYDVANDTWTVKEENLDDKPCGGFIMRKYYLQPE